MRSFLAWIPGISPRSCILLNLCIMGPLMTFSIWTLLSPIEWCQFMLIIFRTGKVYCYEKHPGILTVLNWWFFFFLCSPDTDWGAFLVKASWVFCQPEMAILWNSDTAVLHLNYRYHQHFWKSWSSVSVSVWYSAGLQVGYDAEVVVRAAYVIMLLIIHGDWYNFVRVWVGPCY